MAKKKLIVFTYHDFYEHPEDRKSFYSVKMESFKEQIYFLEKEGYCFVRLSDLIYSGISSLRDKNIIITFDDGYQGIYPALDFLLERNHPAVLFITLSHLAEYSNPANPDKYSRLLKKNKVQGYKNILDIGSHYTRHTVCFFESGAKYRDSLRESFLVLESMFPGQFVPAFAVPGGIYDSNALVAVRNAGFKAVFTSDPVVNDFSGPSDFVFGRYAIKDNYSLFHLKRIIKEEARESFFRKAVLRLRGFLIKFCAGRIYFFFYKTALWLENFLKRRVY